MQIAVGAVIGIVAIGLPAACGGGTQVTALMLCQLDALKILPRDPAMVTPYDAADIVTRVRACHRAEASDGGPP
jgi:hypothetical protein